ncbi:hypothetical protein FGO68_gene13645 [Halteria grandinella]|uniref:Uncharacterized protein n=1 Tax=Halteria grandinella TaxID=5974 RepID=A0A8J8T7I2_HALGN|nr:hypothetical protein FGO68_gene13645 [Halteria grandinella]
MIRYHPLRRPLISPESYSQPHFPLRTLTLCTTIFALILSVPHCLAIEPTSKSTNLLWYLYFIWAFAQQMCFASVYNPTEKGGVKRLSNIMLMACVAGGMIKFQQTIMMALYGMGQKQRALDGLYTAVTCIHCAIYAKYILTMSRQFTQPAIPT